MIRLCNENDRQSVINLFDECFGNPDDAQFNEWFFNKIFNINKTLVYECDGQITSMLQMIDCKVANGQIIYDATYIYAACTQKNYRRRHQMSELIEKSFEIDRQNGKVCSVLIPQEEWLFDFYKQYGYEKGFYLNKKAISSFCKNTAPQELQFANYSDIPALNSIYKNCLNGKFYIERSEEFWKNQIEIAGKTGHGVAVLKNSTTISAYAFLYGTTQNLNAEEIFAQSEQDIEKLLNAIGAKYNCNSITYTNFNDKALNKPFGAIKFYNDTDSNFYGYLNLMYN